MLRKARWLAAVLVGADRTAAPPAHPLRWPGSWNRKGEPRLAHIAISNPASGNSPLLRPGSVAGGGRGGRYQRRKHAGRIWRAAGTGQYAVLRHGGGLQPGRHLGRVEPHRHGTLARNGRQRRRSSNMGRLVCQVAQAPGRGVHRPLAALRHQPTDQARCRHNFPSCRSSGLAAPGAGSDRTTAGRYGRPRELGIAPGRREEAWHRSSQAGLGAASPGPNQWIFSRMRK